MKGYLDNAKIEYVLFHLGHHIDLTDRLRESMIFIKSGEDLSAVTNKIIFNLIERPFDPSNLSYSGDVPVLFGALENNDPFTCTNGNIIFNHDFLKSSFYLLSGYQEVNIAEPDKLGRFAFSSSIQSKLNIITKPVVNYYFEEIIKGIHEFTKIQNLEFVRKKIFSNFAFYLTHDVDRISYYTLNTFIYTVLQLAGFKKSEKNNYELLKDIFRIGFNLIKIKGRKDPYWNFAFLSDEEKKSGIRSTWFFLSKDIKHVDSYYSLKDRKIRDLIESLTKEGHETGLHGTVRSHNSIDALKKIMNEFISVTGQKSIGIRQHRLMWKHPDTAVIHETAGIVYDTSLTFAGHEGFRNSYCHPFRLFDFERNRMLSYWEIPLTIMDSTLFDYRNLSFNEASESISSLLNEVTRFNGIFTLLWHNSYLDETLKPGITEFYTDLLKKIISENPEVLKGIEIINRMR